jgi:hypothetical protein
MRSPPARFASLAEALAKMEKRIKTPAGQWRKEAGMLDVPMQRSLIVFIQKLRPQSGYGKPFLSADPRLFENDLLQLNADLFTMMRIGDHHKYAILYHVLVFRSRILPCEPS